jgi:hypothetical protein
MPERVEERRRSRRAPASHVLAAFAVQGLCGSDQGFGIVRDVSETGIALLTPQPPSVPATVLLRVSVGEELFELTMQVRRVDPHGGGAHVVGLDFVRRDERCSRFLERFREVESPSPR